LYGLCLGIVGVVCEIGQPVCIATGPDADADGYLKICADPYGAWSDDAEYGAGEGDPAWGDEFKPLGSARRQATFTANFYIFKGGAPGPPQVDGTHRILLTTNDKLKQSIAPDDGSLVAELTGSGSEATDTNGDGVDDTLTSEFTVVGDGVDLAIHLIQKVESGGDLPEGISLMTQTLVIDNNGPAVDFELLRHMDPNLPWQGGTDFFLNDSVGTETNGSSADRHVVQREPGTEREGVVVSSPHGDLYYGAINTHDPDGPEGPCVAMGYGTDTQIYDAWGVPCAWQNYIAFVGYDIDGYSGNQQKDGSIGLEMPISIGAGGQETVVVETRYGPPEPPVDDRCPCDCEDPRDGAVDIGDFLAFLAQFGGPGSCDCQVPPNGVVDIPDFLAFLVAFGPCP
jgi:hypothetical protein